MFKSKNRVVETSYPLECKIDPERAGTHERDAVLICHLRVEILDALLERKEVVATEVYAKIGYPGTFGEPLRNRVSNRYILDSQI